MALSRSAQAVKWLDENPGATQAEAARKFDIDRSVVKRAVDKRQGGNMCPCCGQTIKPGAKPGGPGKSSE